MASMTISGAASGIDWDTMIETAIKAARRPATVKLNKRDNLSNKKTLFEEMQQELRTLQTSLTALNIDSTYKAKTIDISRLDSNGSFKGVLTASVNSDAPIGLYDFEVKQLAKAQVQRSDQITSMSSVFTKIGKSSASITLSIAGQNVDVAVNSTDSLKGLASRINTALKTQVPPMNVTASVVDDKLIFKSDYTGVNDKTVSETLTRTANSYDKLTLNIDREALISGEAEIKITSGGKEFNEGVDFDIVGDQIRWRQYEAREVPAGETYTIAYKAKQDDVFKSGNIVRGSGDVDENVLPLDLSALPKTDLVLKDKDGKTYVGGTDFVVSGKSVKWLTDNRPDEDAEYTMEWKASGGEVLAVEVDRSYTDTLSKDYASLSGKTLEIVQGNFTFKEGEDFDVVKGKDGKAVIEWREEAAWNAPQAGSSYTVNIISADGSRTQEYVTRTASDEIDMADYGFTTAEGTFDTNVRWSDRDYSADAKFKSATLTDSTGGKAKISWNSSGLDLTPRSTPDYGAEMKVEYTYQMNTFTLSDDGSGILSAMGLDNFDAEHFTAAQDAIVLLDGETIYSSSNSISPENGNEIIKGMTMELRGVGRVEMEVSHDLQAAVTAIQTVVDNYNSLMSWINTRSSEKQVDQSMRATLDNDDFRMRWGLLYGNSLLRNSKQSMRSIVSQNYTFTFNQRRSSSPVYGTMAQNGMLNNETLRISVGGAAANITISPEDTLKTIADKINSKEKDADAYNLHYDADGKEITLAKAEVIDDVLYITSDKGASVSGNAALNAIKMNYSYYGLYQVGITTTSTDYGKSGEIEFDADKFMTAMETDAENASQIYKSFATNMRSWTQNMMDSVNGQLTNEIKLLDDQIADIDEDLNKLDQRLERKEAYLRKKYAAAEDRIAALSTQASYLSYVTTQLQNQGGGGQNSAG